MLIITNELTHWGQKKWLICCRWHFSNAFSYIDGLVQGRRNSSALAMELHLSCINLSEWKSLYSGSNFTEVCSYGCSWQMSASYQVMAWHQAGDKPLSKPMMTLLTHWGRDKMDAISQTTCSSAFSWMKMFEFRLKFHWSLFLSIQLTIIHHCFR